MALVLAVLVGIGIGYGFRGLINRIGKSVEAFVKGVVEPRVAAVENRAIALEAKLEAKIKAEVEAIKASIIAKV